MIEEKDLVFYMGGDVHYCEEVIAHMDIEVMPFKYILKLNDEKFSFETRKEAVEKIILFLEKNND
jgi:hypothetical protein